MFDAIASLPIAAVLPDIGRALNAGDDLVLEAPPGAGKTTAVPLALLTEPWLAGQTILLLEPRRVAARNAASRMASLLGERVGETVGYRIRLDTRVSARTRLEVITEGVLTRRLQQDPELGGVGLVIFDEFHERSLESDLGLALTLEARALFRETAALKLLVMSATLDGARVSQLLGGAPVLRATGRSFPVGTSYLGRGSSGAAVATAAVTTAAVTTAAVTAVKRALAERSGSILVFLPGQREIDRVAASLAAAVTADTAMIAPMYGRLSLRRQQQAIEAPPPGTRKIVLATNIAESSLTINGIDTVVDTGLVRVARFDPVSGLTRLDTRRIARDSAEQRRGRAGRLSPGHCYRLWSEEEHGRLEERSTPAVLHEDLGALVLQVLAWGYDRPDGLAWLDRPPQAAWEQGLQLLVRLGGAKRGEAGNYGLTPHGVNMAQLPLSPRLAHLLLVGRALGAMEVASLLAALVTEGRPGVGSGADLQPLLAILEGGRDCPSDWVEWRRRTREQARRYRKAAAAIDRVRSLASDAVAEDVPSLLVASAWPDRIARRRDGESNAYQLSNGRGATLSPDDPLQGDPWLAAVDIGGQQGTTSDHIHSALALDPVYFDEFLAPLVHSSNRLEWDERREALVAERLESTGAIVISRKPLRPLPPGALQQALVDVVRRKGLSILDWTQPARQWRARVRLLAELQPGAWPDVSDDSLLAHLDNWLLPHLDGVRSSDDFARLDLSRILPTLLDWQQTKALDELLPRSVTVPSGSKIAIDYTRSPPVLAVKLQEMFGCETTPRVAGGRVELLVHLLSPAGRPLQITRDLAGFWRTGYRDVRKEMLGRYPRHPWPDDPIGAQATRHTARRLKKPRT